MQVSGGDPRRGDLQEGSPHMDLTVHAIHCSVDMHKHRLVVGTFTRLLHEDQSVSLLFSCKSQFVLMIVPFVVTV